MSRQACAPLINLIRQRTYSLQRQLILCRMRMKVIENFGQDPRHTNQAESVGQFGDLTRLVGLDLRPIDVFIIDVGRIFGADIIFTQQHRYAATARSKPDDMISFLRDWTANASSPVNNVLRPKDSLPRFTFKHINWLLILTHM